MEELNLLKLLDQIEEGLTLEELSEVMGIKKEDLKPILDKLVSLNILNDYYQKYLFNNERYHVGKIVMSHNKLRLETKNGTKVSADVSIYKENSYVVYEAGNKSKIKDRVIYNISKSETQTGEIVLIDGSKYLMDNDKIIPINDDKLIEGALVEYTDNGIKTNIIKVIGYKNEPNIEIKKLAHKLGIDTEYPEEVNLESESARIEIKEQDIKDRVDLRSDVTVTIDCDETCDIDDGVCYIGKDNNGNDVVRIHIADVNEEVKKGSASDMLAHKRTTSHYPGNAAIHMLHPKYANGICSLNPNVDRLARTFELVIDKNGNLVIENCKMYPSVIRSRKKMSYSEVDKVLQGNPREDYKEYTESLLKLNEIAKRIRNKRVKNGLIQFESDEPKYIINDSGEVLKIENRVRTDASDLIEDFMIITGECQTKLLSDSGIIHIVRNEELPDSESIDKEIDALASVGEFIPKKEEYTSMDIQQIIEVISKREDSQVWSTRLKRRMPKATYGTVSRGHAGLATLMHSQGTSPIRRIGDKDNHQLIREYYDTGIEQPLSQRKKLEAFAKYINMMELKAQKFEREANKIFNCSYMQKFIGQDFKARVLNFDKNGIDVLLNAGMQGFVKYDSIEGIKDRSDEHSLTITSLNKNLLLKIGSQLDLTLVKSDKENRQIIFELKQKVKELKR